MKLKPLNRSYAVKMLKLQMRGTTPDQFTPRDIVSIREALDRERVVGVFSGRTLIAYSIFARASVEDCNQSEAGWNTWKFAGTVVHPSHRGQGIQKKALESHIAFAIASGIDTVMAYVHCENKASIKSIEHSGLKFFKDAFIEDKQDFRQVYKLELN
ncbi:hypothetical protein [Vibrio phage BX-1]|nr:hypothetical protein [Vibrio phage BX-1]